VLNLAQAGPGRYRGSFPAGEQGAYLVGVANRRDKKMIGSEVASLVVPYSPEHRALEVNEGLLRDVATLSGGAAPTKPEEAFTAERRKVRVWVEGWPYLFGLAMLLFLPDVALRRLQLPGRRRRREGGNVGGPSGSGPAREAGPMAAKFGGRGRR
jgi:hypothetical protein